MLRDNALENKVIVVTGGGSGLGKAMTKYFMELGAKVAITSRDLEKLKTLTGNVAYISLSKFLVENAANLYYSKGYNNEAIILGKTK